MLKTSTGGNVIYLEGWKNKLKMALMAYKGEIKISSMTYFKYHKNHKFEGRKVLNVGCGKAVYPAPNVTNLDMFPHPGVQEVWDLSKTPLPFKDGEFDFIIANHILEHVPNWWECFKELARIVKVGGKIEVWGPGDGGSSQLGYRDHINTINYCSFTGLRDTIRNMSNLWEDHEALSVGAAKDLQRSPTIYRVKPVWWLYLLPTSVLTWLCQSARNIVEEQGWEFVKMPPIEKSANVFYP